MTWKQIESLEFCAIEIWYFNGIKICGNLVQFTLMDYTGLV